MWTVPTWIFHLKPLCRRSRCLFLGYTYACSIILLDGEGMKLEKCRNYFRLLPEISHKQFDFLLLHIFHQFNALCGLWMGLEMFNEITSLFIFNSMRTVRLIPWSSFFIYIRLKIRKLTCVLVVRICWQRIILTGFRNKIAPRFLTFPTCSCKNFGKQSNSTCLNIFQSTIILVSVHLQFCLLFLSYDSYRLRISNYTVAEFINRVQ